MSRILIGLCSLLLAGLVAGCEQESNATAAPAAASADQPARVPDDASAKTDEALEASRAAAAKSGEAVRAAASEAADSARQTAAAAYAQAGHASDLAGQAASDIAADLKKGASEIAHSTEEAAGEVGRKLSSAADKAGDVTREAAAVAAEKAGQAADKAEGAMSNAADKARDWADDLRSPREPASPAGDSGLTMAFLANQRFSLKMVNEADYYGEQVPFIEFDNNSMVHGKVCNTFRGPGKLTNGVLTVEALASTRMLCPVNGLDELETRIFDMLNKGAEISMNGSRLMLKQGGSVLVYEADTGLAG